MTRHDSPELLKEMCVCVCLVRDPQETIESWNQHGSPQGVWPLKIGEFEIQWRLVKPKIRKELIQRWLHFDLAYLIERAI